MAAKVKKEKETQTLSAAKVMAISKAFAAAQRESAGIGANLAARFIAACGGVTINAADSQAIARECAKNLGWAKTAIKSRASNIRLIVNAGEPLVAVMRHFNKKHGGAKGLSWNSALVAARALKRFDGSVAKAVARLQAGAAGHPKAKTNKKVTVSNALNAWYKASPKMATQIEKAAKLLGVTLSA